MLLFINVKYYPYLQIIYSRLTNNGDFYIISWSLAMDDNSILNSSSEL